MKLCSRCKISKQLTDFSSDITRKDGLYPYCKPCKSLYKKQHPENPDTRKRQRNKPESKNKKKSYDFKRWNNYPEYRLHVKNEILKKTYGISLVDYTNILQSQNSKCAICNVHKDFAHKGLYVDHCHITKNVRGLLCGECNLGLGKFKEDSNLIGRAFIYLNEKEK